MPELPDVEHFRRFLAGRAVGARIERVVTTDPQILRNASPATLDGALRGHRFEEPERHGKWLVAWTTGPAVLIHFGMTGDLGWVARGDPAAVPRHRHDRVVFETDRGELRYRNMRKLGGVWLTHDRDEAARLLAPLGPDALRVSPRLFRSALGRRRGQVKAALMNQAVVAGVGNLAADEALWQARIHPARRLEDLTEEERRRVELAVRRVLRTWVDRFDDLPRGWLLPVRGPDGSCPRCGARLARTVVGGRSTYFCPVCQPYTPGNG
jgi:formamidopyrimidine-DNA glycosylase